MSRTAPLGDTPLASEYGTLGARVEGNAARLPSSIRSKAAQGDRSVTAACRIRLVLAVVALGASVALPGAAVGQGYNVWYAQCLSDENSQEPPLCTVEILLDPDQGEFVLYFVYRDEGGMPLVLTGGEQALGKLSIKADDEDPIETDKCEVGLCYFEPPDSTKLKNLFLKGRKAEVYIEDSAGDRVLTQTITLNGFQKALFEAEAAAQATPHETEEPVQ